MPRSLGGWRAHYDKIFNTLPQLVFSDLLHFPFMLGLRQKDSAAYYVRLYDGIIGTSWDAEGQDQFQAEQDWICVEEIFQGSSVS